jgi:hypothetical protein
MKTCLRKKLITNNEHLFEEKKSCKCYCKTKGSNSCVPCGCRLRVSPSLDIYENAANKVQMDYYSDQIISLHALLFNENVWWLINLLQGYIVVLICLTSVAGCTRTYGRVRACFCHIYSYATTLLKN